MLEDLGFYCIDNIPAALLKPFILHTVHSPEATYDRTAIGLDARNTAAEIATVPKLIDELRRSGIQCEVLFLVAGDEELLRRFAETRRIHPMSRARLDLREFIALERQLLEPIINAADLVIDTSGMGVHELRETIQRLEGHAPGRLSLTFESFGFKHGIPGDVRGTSCSTPAPCPTRTGSPTCANSPAGTRTWWRSSKRRRTRAASSTTSSASSRHASPNTSATTALHHGRHRLHRRPAPFRVHRRTACRAIRRAVSGRSRAP